MGIRTLDGLRSNSQLRFRMIGIKSTTTGVLLMKADAAATISRIMRNASFGLPLECLAIFSVTKPSAPVRTMAWLSRNTAPTVTTAGLAKPATASSGLATPVTASAMMTPMDVMSTDSFSLISRKSAATSMMDTIQISMASRLMSVGKKTCRTWLLFRPYLNGTRTRNVLVCIPTRSVGTRRTRRRGHGRNINQAQFDAQE